MSEDTHYQLRLFENDVEVSSTSVAIVPGADNYPKVGQTISDYWLVTGVISHNARERCLRVERIAKPPR